MKIRERKRKREGEGERATEERKTEGLWKSILSWKSAADTRHHELACVRIVYPFQSMKIRSKVIGYYNPRESFILHV